MINFSRRQLAAYAVDELVDKKPVAALAVRLAATLVVSGRKKEVELLLADIDQELENRRLLSRARVTSAYPLSVDLRRELTAQLKKMTGSKEVVLQEEMDKTVLGGIKIETTARSWDHTVKRTLLKLNEESRPASERSIYG